jgi:replication factor C large subunit
MQFIDQYRPKKINEIIGQDESLRQLMRFVLNVINKKSMTAKKGILLYGPPGTGKTAAAHAIASEINAEAIELNASDFRDRESIKSILGNAIRQKSLFDKHKLIIVDELEGIHGREDYGGLNELLKILDESVYPVVMITNQPYNDKLKSLRKQAELVEFKKLDEESLKKIMQKICTEEKIIINSDTLKRIVLLSDGDARAAVNDLQTITSGRKKLEESHIKVLGKREREETIFNALNFIFKGKSLAVLNAFDNVDMETDELIMWIDENLPMEYSGKELARAYRALSKADIFRRRIIRNQHWRFMVYINELITAGIAFAKDSDKNKFVKYKRATRLLKMWIENQTKKKVIAKKLAGKIHCSMKKALKEMPYLERIYKDADIREKINNELGLEKEETFYLLAR